MSNALGVVNSSMMLSYSFRGSKGEEFIGFNSHLPLLPASNMKIITGYAAYLVLGKKYNLSASFIRDHETLVVSGGPTPFLFSSILRTVLDKFGYSVPIENKEIKKVKFINPSIDDVQINPFWIYGDSRYSYQAKITNFSINENCTSKKPGEITISSEYLHRNENKFRPVKDPKQYFTKEILSLPHDGVLSDLPNGMSVDSENNTLKFKLIDVIKHMEYESCNFSAEVLFKMISARDSKSVGSWNKSVQVMKKLVKPILGLHQKISIVDGSGLSRNNFLTTSFLSGFIFNIVKNGNNRFLDYLPSPGKGTLIGRLERYGDEKILAKTGSLSGVSALSGYIKSRKVAFSIIINNYLGNHKPSMIVDEVLSTFLENNEIRLDSRFPD